MSDIIRNLKREIDEHGTIDVLIKEIEKITSREEQDQLLIEENERMRTIVAELRKAISDRKAANEWEEERLTKKLTLTRVKCFTSRGRFTNIHIYDTTVINHEILTVQPLFVCVSRTMLKRNLLAKCWQDEKERLKLIKDAEMKYVRVWEAARREQYVLRYELDINELEKTLNDHCVRERRENHVNDVLARYLTRRTAVSESQTPS